MAIITWSDGLSVNVNEIDEQHRKLVALLNELFDAVNSKKGNDILKRVFADLLDYTVYHFSTEERHMDTLNYPDSDIHKAEHKELTKQALDFNEKFKQGKALIDILLMNFLKDWLVKHIMGSDKKLGTFLKDKGIS